MEKLRKIIQNYVQIKHLRDQVCMAGSNYARMQEIFDEDRKLHVLAANEVSAVEEKIKELEVSLKSSEGYWYGCQMLLDDLVDAYDAGDWDSIKRDLMSMSEERKDNE